MDNLKRALRELISKSCDAVTLLKSPIPVRVWSRLAYDNDWVIPANAEQRFHFDPFAYLLIGPMSLSPVMQTVIQALRGVPEINAKITIDLDDEKNSRIYSQTNAIWLWKRLVLPYFELSFHKFQRIIFDEDVFDSTASQFIDHINDIQPLLVKHLCPLLNFRVAKVVDLGGGITIRPLTLDEIETWLNDDQLKTVRDVNTQNLFSIQCAIERSYIETQGGSETENKKRFQQILFQHQINRSLIKAIRLITDRPVSIAFTDMKSESVLILNHQILALTPPTAIPEFPALIPVFNDEQANLLTSLWKRLDSNGNSQVNLAFTRLTGAFDRMDESDKLIDYWIGLESLFTPDSTQELKFRASLRIAAFLGQTSEQRRIIYEDLKRSYDWRSAIVHGNHREMKRLSKKASLSEMSAKIRAYLRSAVLQIVQSDERFDATSIEMGLLNGFPESDKIKSS